MGAIEFSIIFENLFQNYVLEYPPLEIKIFQNLSCFIKKIFYWIRNKILIKEIKLTKIFRLWFKSYESCSIFRIQNFVFQNSLKNCETTIYAHHTTPNFISDSVACKFRKYAHANFENRIFFKLFGTSWSSFRTWGYCWWNGGGGKMYLKYFDNEQVKM